MAADIVGFLFLLLALLVFHYLNTRVRKRDDEAMLARIMSSMSDMEANVRQAVASARQGTEKKMQNVAAALETSFVSELRTSKAQVKEDIGRSATEYDRLYREFNLNLLNRISMMREEIRTMSDLAYERTERAAAQRTAMLASKGKTPKLDIPKLSPEEKAVLMKENPAQCVHDGTML